VLVAQQETRFVPCVTVVPIGATVRFTHRDSLDHPLRSQPGGPLGGQAAIASAMTAHESAAGADAS